MAKRSTRSSQKKAAVRATQRRKAVMPEPLTEAIEAERGKLMKASSFLECLVISLSYPPEDLTEGPYFPDVAEAARDLIEEALLGLDTVSLHKALKGHKVEENVPKPNGESWPDRTGTSDLLTCVDVGATVYLDCRRLPEVNGVRP